MCQLDVPARCAIHDAIKAHGPAVLRAAEALG
jgi:hypothetical protein